MIDASRYRYSMEEYRNNSTTPDGAEQLTIPRVIVVALSPLGLLCNCSFLFVVLCVQSMRTPFNTFLSNLAVAEILLLISVLIGTLTSGDTDDEPRPEIVFPLVGACFAANLFVAVGAAERYLAVCAPLKYVLIARDQRRAVKISLVVWLAVGIYVALFALAFHALYQTCKTAIVIPNAVISVAILSADGFFYLSILRRLRKRPSSVHRRRIMIKLAATALVIYADATVHATIMITRHLIHKEMRAIFTDVFLILKVAASTIVPIVLGFLSLDLHELSAKNILCNYCQRAP